MIKEIEIPDNCDFIIEDNKIIIKEKKEKVIPRTWKEFCENYPVKSTECYFGRRSEIYRAGETLEDSTRLDDDWCTSKEEAEAFLTLIQLRQLRKAWVGDWEQPSSRTYIAVIAYNINDKKVIVETGNFWSNMTLSFPTKEMAYDFLCCFRDLCEIAKELL